MADMNFNSIRRFYFQDLIVDHDACGKIPLGVIRVFWKVATEMTRRHDQGISGSLNTPSTGVSPSTGTSGIGSLANAS